MTSYLRAHTKRGKTGSVTAFSLIEVVLAVGLFSFAIVGVIGLLGPATRQVADVLDANVAARLAENINAEIKRLGFQTIRDAVCGVDNTLDNSIYLVATADGSRILRTAQIADGSLTNPNQAAENDLTSVRRGIAERDRFFLIEVGRLVGTASLDYPNNPLSYGLNGAVLPLRVHLSWPFYVPIAPRPAVSPVTWNDTSVEGRFVEPRSRSSYVLNMSVNR